MRAAVVTTLGREPEIVEAPEPERTEGAVLVEVLATPLNPLDVNVGAGRYFGGHPPLPFIPGSEAVGRVIEGETLAPGTLVWAYGDGIGRTRDGALAERVALAEDAVVPLPADADPVLAGALGVAGLAGWLPLAHRAPVEEGDLVLVLGATGTVGLVACQAARALGASRVVAAGRRADALERARRLGADAVVSLDAEDLPGAFRDACGGEGPTYVVDPLWGEPAAAAARAAAPGARLVNIGQSAGPVASLLSSDVRGKQLSVLGYSNFATPRDVVAREYLRLVEHARSGEIEVEIESVPFERAAEAWRRQDEGAGVKLVVVP